MFCNIKSVLLCLVFFITTLNAGFVVDAATNPVSLYVYEDNGIYEVIICLKEDIQINSFQLKLKYDKNYLQPQEADFDEKFKSMYNSNKSALLKSSIKNNETDNCVIFLGVQTDDAVALQRAGTIIGLVRFKIELTDAGELAKQLDTIRLLVEVMEGSDGNIITEEEGLEVRAVVINNRDDIDNEENEAVDEEDLREDKAYRDKTNVNDSVTLKDSDKTDNNIKNKNGNISDTNKQVESDNGGQNKSVYGEDSPNENAPVSESTTAGVIADENKQSESSNDLKIEKEESKDNKKNSESGTGKAKSKPLSEIAPILLAAGAIIVATGAFILRKQLKFLINKL